MRDQADTTPSPEMYAAVLGRFVWTSPFHHDLPSVMEQLVDHLTPAQAATLPSAFAGAIPLLVKERDKMHFAAEIASELDFHETAEAIVRMAALHDDPEMLRIAATLCGNPAVPKPVWHRVAHLAGGNPFLRMRLDASTLPSTPDEQRLYQQLWPGSQTEPNSFPTTPRVVLDELIAPDVALQLSVSACKAGASVSRLPPKGDVPLWFGHKTVFVSTDEAAQRVLASYPAFPEERILSEWTVSRAAADLDRLKLIDAALPADGKLRLDYIT